MAFVLLGVMGTHGYDSSVEWAAKLCVDCGTPI
jgi:hypothetical protein